MRKAIEQEKISLGRGAEVLLMDANVLIDYQKSDLSVLGLVNKHVAEVHVLTPGRPTAKSPPPKCALGIWQLGASGSIWPFAMSLSRDFIEFIACLNASRVEYLLVGGHALAFHGLPRFTKDIDFWIRPSEENADRVLAALESFGFG